MVKNKKVGKYNYSPDVKTRDKIDKGFSKGWGFHFPSNEDYWLDCHTHYGRQFTPKAYYETYETFEKFFANLDAFRLDSIITIINNPEMIPVCKAIASHSPNFNWLYWMHYEKPDHKIMEEAIKQGAKGLKLHNNAILVNKDAKPDVWLSKKWDKVFKVVEKAKLPVLWHITQRMSVSPYHGGNEFKTLANSNQSVLAATLEVVKKYPKIPFIGAHQIYLGLEQLEKLFKKYKNLYIDTSVGFFLRWADTLNEPDKEVYRDFFTKYSDRILFGSDCTFVGKIDEYLTQSFLAHARFILNLNLTDDVLQKVAHKNAEKLFKIEPLTWKRRGNTRP
ncbi:amidohydrolase [bacterium]|nr:amidohydrolase [bacterium]